MADFLSGVIAFIGIASAALLLKFAWYLWRMPESEQRELRESYERKRWNRGMVRRLFRGR